MKKIIKLVAGVSLLGAILNAAPKTDIVDTAVEAGSFKTLVAAVKAAGGGTPAIQAKIQDGGDAAQYVKLFMTVQKPDNSTTITKDDLANIGQAEQQANVRGKAQMIMVDLN